MLDFDTLRGIVAAQSINPLFVTVSGAHLYGFPSPDSDVDLRGCHLAPLRDLVGLDLPNQTVEPKAVVGGIEIEMVSHEIGKYIRLLVKNNGYVLEQIFSPLVVYGEPFLETLRPLARRCITRHHYWHYRGFLATEQKLLEKQQPKSVKSVLYAYRVVLTGIHLLRTGAVEANLVRLAESSGLSFVPELIAMKKAEKIAVDLDWEFHRTQLTRLEGELDRAWQELTLPEDRDRRAVHEFLVNLRLPEGAE